MELGMLAQLTGGTLRRDDQRSRQFTGVSIDSRSIGSGQLFIALCGRRVDGHEYVAAALERGATAALVNAGSDRLATLEQNAPVVSVADTYSAMIRLATSYRDSVPATRIGITGSNGKTTTKEITHTLLSAVATNVFRSPGNLNNLYGAPLAFFAMPRDTKYAVLEMGVSIPGEMTKLAEIVQPQVVAITNVGATHLEFLGSVENVAREKLSLVAESAPDTKLIVNADDALLVREAKKLGRELITFGVTQPATYQAGQIEPGSDGSTLVTVEEHRFRMNLFGAHQVYNLLTAYAIAKSVGLSFDGIDTESIRFVSSPMRGELLSSHGVSFIVDCYNANPESVTSGLNSFVAYKTSGRKVVILGDMLELGESAGMYHRRMGEQAVDRRIDIAVFVGPLSRVAFEASKQAGRASNTTFHFPNARSCARETAAMFQEGDLVYVKGSRGIGLEIVVEPWRVPEGVN